MKTLGAKKNFLAIESKYSSLDTSKIAILSAPYEHTVSYGGGARKGPQGILEASAYVEFYDDEFERELCFDIGIATLRPIDFSDTADRKALNLIEEHVRKLLEMEKFVVTLGGEHTISTAPILAHLRKYPVMSLLHFDAHSDLRDSYEGSKYSHACFAARVAEQMNPERITQVGIRAQCIEEAQFIKANGVKTFYANAIRRGVHGENWQQTVVDTLGDEVYVTFDVDYFDPSIMPATGTPEPDGFLYSETLDLFRTLLKSEKRIIGFDVVELAPMKGLSHPDLLTARLVYKMLNFAFADHVPAYPRLDAMIPLRTKPLHDLTLEDLQASPVWKSFGGSDAEAIVEPSSRTALSENDSDTFLAITDFVLGNGQKHVGFCSPVDDSGLDYVQPVIVTPQGQIRFWFDESPSRRVIAEQWLRLGIPESQVFPIKYECLVPVDGRIVKGAILNVESMGSAV